MLLEPMKIPWLVFCNLLCQYYNVGDFVDKFGSYEDAAIFSKNTMPNGRRLVAYIQSWHSQLLLLLLLATFWQQQQQPGGQKFQTWRLADSRLSPAISSDTGFTGAHQLRALGMFGSYNFKMWENHWTSQLQEVRLEVRTLHWVPNKDAPTLYLWSLFRVICRVGGFLPPFQEPKWRVFNWWH
jgi:hypothetical protein